MAGPRRRLVPFKTGHRPPVRGVAKKRDQRFECGFGALEGARSKLWSARSGVLTDRRIVLDVGRRMPGVRFVSPTVRKGVPAGWFVFLCVRHGTPTGSTKRAGGPAARPRRPAEHDGRPARCTWRLEARAGWAAASTERLAEAAGCLGGPMAAVRALRALVGRAERASPCDLRRRQCKRERGRPGPVVLRVVGTSQFVCDPCNNADASTRSLHHVRHGAATGEHELHALQLEIRLAAEPASQRQWYPADRLGLPRMLESAQD